MTDLTIDETGCHSSSSEFANYPVVSYVYNNGNNFTHACSNVTITDTSTGEVVYDFVSGVRQTALWSSGNGGTGSETGNALNGMTNEEFVELYPQLLLIFILAWGARVVRKRIFARS